MPPIEPGGLPRGRLLGLFSTVFVEFKRDLVLMPLELCGGEYTFASLFFLRDALSFFCVFSASLSTSVFALSLLGPASSWSLSFLEPPALGSVRLFVCPFLVSFYDLYESHMIKFVQIPSSVGYCSCLMNGTWGSYFKYKFLVFNM